MWSLVVAILLAAPAGAIRERQHAPSQLHAALLGSGAHPLTVAPVSIDAYATPPQVELGPFTYEYTDPATNKTKKKKGKTTAVFTRAEALCGKDLKPGSKCGRQALRPLVEQLGEQALWTVAPAPTGAPGAWSQIFGMSHQGKHNKPRYHLPPEALLTMLEPLVASWAVAAVGLARPPCGAMRRAVRGHVGRSGMRPRAANTPQGTPRRGHASTTLWRDPARATGALCVPTCGRPRDPPLDRCFRPARRLWAG